MNKCCGSSQGRELNTCICPATAELGPTANLTHTGEFEIRTAKKASVTRGPTDSLCSDLRSFPRSPVGEYIHYPLQKSLLASCANFLIPVFGGKLEQQVYMEGKR